MISQYLLKNKKQSKVSGAFCLCTYFNTDAAMSHLATFFFGAYDYLLGFIFKVDSRAMMVQFEELAEKSAPNRKIMHIHRRMKTFTREACDVIIKGGGFKNRKDYYEKTSFNNKLGKITVPVFYLNSEDDPLFGPDVIVVDN